MDNNTNQKVYEVITDTIIKKLEEGTVPWHKPWNGAENSPKNLISKKEYHGINAFLTACSGFSSPYWVSFKQCKELGGSVKSGEHGLPIIYWNWVEKKDKDGKVTDKIPFLRYYRVFNLEQCENIPIDKVPLPVENTLNTFEKIKECETIVDEMPNKPVIKHEQQRAFYSPLLDYVNMPIPETFNNEQGYYSTLFHELTHSTGHESRVNRKGVSSEDGEWSSFGSAPYAREELVAEMGAAFLCGFVGIENKTIDNSAAYIKSWLGRLKNDSKLVVTAAAQAQKAVNFILKSEVSHD